MTLPRRRFLSLSASAAAIAVASAAHAAAPAMAELDRNTAPSGPRPGTSDDQTEALQRLIDRAASTRQPLTLPPGAFHVSGLSLPAGAQINGVPGATRLVANSAKPIFLAAKADNVRLSGIIFDGGGQPLPRNTGLVTLLSGDRVQVTDCEFIGAAAYGLMLDRIGGEVSGCTLVGAADAAIFSLDARGLSITRNKIRRAGNNGIQVWRRAAGDDGTIVADNRVEEIGAQDGGTGQNGNGINVFRAGNVTVRGNRVHDCVFSAIRGNAASSMRIVENSCTQLGEVALYAEFGFEGAIISNNTVDGAGHGISVTNFNEGGRLAVISGNILRNLAPQPHARIANETHGVGIYAEADTAVTGNVIEKAAQAGIMAGWGRFLRDVTVTGNVVRGAPIGIGVSVTSGAGAALIANNLISGATRGAILGMEQLQPVTGDLAKDGTLRYSQLVVSGNRVN
ncbi:MAG: TIGR03808 family TAT-translocated repetitive protein [Xanthobacteraceae bacterium]